MKDPYKDDDGLLLVYLGLMILAIIVLPMIGWWVTS